MMTRALNHNDCGWTRHTHCLRTLIGFVQISQVTLVMVGRSGPVDSLDQLLPWLWANPSVAYLGGGALGDAPPLWPEHKFFEHIEPLLQWGGDTPSAHSTPLAPPALRTSRLWLCPPPFTTS